MSESLGQHEPKPVDPEYLQCQLDIMSLCDKILALKPDKYRIAFWDFRVDVDPNNIQNALQTGSFSDLMLRDGDSLSSPQSHPHLPELNLFVDDDNLFGISMRAWKWEYKKFRIDPDGPQKPPHDVVEYPEEKDLQYKLDIRLHYIKGDKTAVQILSVQTGSLSAGKLPRVSRDVYSNEYAETGYEGHNQVGRSAQSEDEVDEFARIAKDLFAKRVT